MGEKERRDEMINKKNLPNKPPKGSTREFLEGHPPSFPDGKKEECWEEAGTRTP